MTQAVTLWTGNAVQPTMIRNAPASGVVVVVRVVTRAATVRISAEPAIVCTETARYRHLPRHLASQNYLSTISATPLMGFVVRQMTTKSAMPLGGSAARAQGNVVLHHSFAAQDACLPMEIARLTLMRQHQIRVI